MRILGQLRQPLQSPSAESCEHAAPKWLVSSGCTGCCSTETSIQHPVKLIEQLHVHLVLPTSSALWLQIVQLMLASLLHDTVYLAAFLCCMLYQGGLTIALEVSHTGCTANDTNCMLAATQTSLTQSAARHATNQMHCICQLANCALMPIIILQCCMLAN